MQVTDGKGETTIGGLWNILQNAEDNMSMSLTQFNRRSIITSRVFIERPLADEEILTPLMLNLMNLYTGLIMSSMNMNTMITSTKKVRDAMSVVATEDYSINAKPFEEAISMYFTGQPNMFIGNDRGEEMTPQPYTKIDYGSGSKVLEPENKNPNLPSGRIIEVNFGTDKNDPKNRLTVNLFLNLLPYFIPTEVAQQFVSLNFSPSVKQRWLQVTAGEISFFSDFLLGQDMRKKRTKAYRQDKTGALKEMEDRKQNSLANYWLKLAMITPERQNIANTILIFEKNSFDKACSAAGLNFKSYANRQKFFNKTFAMILCTVDPMYNKIDMYYHGLEPVSHFTFDQMKRNSKTESVDLIKIMENYAKGMAPRF